MMVANDGHASVFFPMLVWNNKVLHKHYAHAHSPSDCCGILSSAYILFLEILMGSVSFNEARCFCLFYLLTGTSCIVLDFP